MIKLLRLVSLISLIHMALCAPFYTNNNPSSNPKLLKVTEEKLVESQSWLFEGDIAGVIEPGMTTAELRSKLQNWSKAGVFAHQRWPNGQVHYQISSVFGSFARDLIIQAMNDIQAKTGAVQFVQRTWQTDYVNIIYGNSCSSYVGKTGGSQDLTLGNGCVSTGYIVHELMHALGFFHEQSRTDRDSYVDINWSNIQAGGQTEFQVYHSETFGTTYDFGSIMHYPQNMFAVDPTGWTIKPKPHFAGNPIGQLSVLSPTDIQEIRAMYGVYYPVIPGTLGTVAPVTPGTPVSPVIPGTPISPVIPGRTCAMVFHGLNFGGKKVTLTSGQNGNLDAVDQGQVKSAIISGGCKLTTYSAAHFQGMSMEYPTTAPYEGFFNLLQSCSSFRCTCV